MSIKHVNQKEQQTIKDLALKIKTFFPDSKLWLYGSRVIGTARQDSDYDIMVVYKYHF